MKGGTCSALNSIELGTGTFPLTCSGSNPLNMLDGKCYSSCPANTQSFSDGAVPICGKFSPFSPSLTHHSPLACPSHCATCDSTQCLTCYTGYLLYQKDCVDSCPAKMYSDGTTCVGKRYQFVVLKSENIRIDCPTHCATCDSTQCLTCDDSNYFVYDKACVASCPAKTYFTGTTCQGNSLKFSLYLFLRKIVQVTVLNVMHQSAKFARMATKYQAESAFCPLQALPQLLPHHQVIYQVFSNKIFQFSKIIVPAIIAISVGAVVILILLTLGLHLWKKKQILLAAKKYNFSLEIFF